MTTKLHRWSTPAATTRGRDGAITPDGVYKVLTRYRGIVGIDINGFGPHALRATANRHRARTQRGPREGP